MSSQPTHEEVQGRVLRNRVVPPPKTKGQKFVPAKEVITDQKIPSTDIARLGVPPALSQSTEEPISEPTERQPSLPVELEPADTATPKFYVLKDNNQDTEGSAERDIDHKEWGRGENHNLTGVPMDRSREMEGTPADKGLRHPTSRAVEALPATRRF